ncbi:MAG: NUDIX domain-containing protein [Dehalococcoidia bacterium]|nr:NUDIX domain-containing protein [Dehalococcoidia bacterium]
MAEKVYGFVLRDGAEERELLVFEHAGIAEAGLQVPGGTVEGGETPLQAVSREVLEESGLPLGGWETATTFEVDGQLWRCYVTTPAMVLPDSWRCEPLGPERAQGLRFEYRWTPLEGGDELAGAQEEARRAVAAFVAGRGG